MYNDLISVIVPVFNCEKWIDHCITSIRAQTYQNLQIIIVNDGSTDSSLSIIKSHALQDNRIIYIDKQNEGISKTRNCGLSRATGEYVTFVDSDDYINEEMIEKLLSAAKHYDADISICFDPSWKRLDNSIEVLCAADYQFQSSYSSLVAWGGLYSKKVIQGLSFDETVHVSEDILFKSKAVRNSEKLVFLYEPLYNYVIYDNSACHGSYNKKKITEIEAWKKIVATFTDTNTEISARATLNQRCRHVLDQYFNDSQFSIEDYKYCIEEYRKSFKYNYMTLGIKGKISTLLFYLFPRLVLKIKLKVK